MDIDFIKTGQRIREARNLRGLTAEVLAEKIGLATESLRHIENASSKPSLQTLYRIATVLDVSLDYITGRTPDISAAMVTNCGEDQGLTPSQAEMLKEVVKSLTPVISKYI